MKHYNARIETRRRGPLSEDDIDRYMDGLAAYHPSISLSPYGYVTARISIPADSLAQAATSATAVVEQVIGDALSLELLDEATFDQRQGYAPVPELIGSAEAADLLGVSPQRIRQMIEEGKLAAHRVGERAYVMTRSEVEAKRSAI